MPSVAAPYELASDIRRRAEQIRMQNIRHAVRGSIAARSITADEIAVGTITGTEIANGSIGRVDIAANTITANNIQAGAITADKLNVTSLSAITANLGTVTAGNINGATISARQRVRRYGRHLRMGVGRVISILHRRSFDSCRGGPVQSAGGQRGAGS